LDDIYDITIYVNHAGDTIPENGALIRLMSFNRQRTGAINMNDVYGRVTEFRVLPNRRILAMTFTVIGEYEHFFIHYPHQRFDISIYIRNSNKIPKKLVCDYDCCNQCSCYERDNTGYIRLISSGFKSRIIDVPVYYIDNETNRKTLFDDFNQLRQLFDNITQRNTLITPSFSLSSSSLTSTINKQSIQCDPNSINFKMMKEFESIGRNETIQLKLWSREIYWISFDLSKGVTYRPSINTGNNDHSHEILVYDEGNAWIYHKYIPFCSPYFVRYSWPAFRMFILGHKRGAFGSEENCISIRLYTSNVAGWYATGVETGRYRMCYNSLASGDAVTFPSGSLTYNGDHGAYVAFRLEAAFVVDFYDVNFPFVMTTRIVK
jgi:hypothetical protein